jgi:DNA-binding NarL/FixJ family response regulator
LNSPPEDGSARPIRVVIADGQRMFRELLRNAIAPECEVVGEAGDGESTVSAVMRTRPNVVLLDAIMPGIGGLAAAHQLARRLDKAALLIVSMYSDEEYVIESFKAGVAGYLLKSDAADQILPAIRSVHAGLRYVSPFIAEILVRGICNPKTTPSSRNLTPREREVLCLIAGGSTTKHIASQLNISPKTAQVHRDNLKEKLDLRTTAALVRYAIETKLIRLDPRIETNVSGVHVNRRGRKP